VSAESEAREERLRAGLCAGCQYAQKVVSDRGASFYLCHRSFTDPSFAKYPVLPVRSCAGYESKQG
jgi:hypothetical protein